MVDIHLTLNSSWPYDEAVRFMDDAHLRVERDAHAFFVGAGSHSEQVITIGKNPNAQGNWYEAATSPHILIRQLDRGGGMTAHEPGQLVLYPVFNIEHFCLSVPQLIALLEDTMLDFLYELGLLGTRSPCGAGVFLGEHKVGFIGLRIKDRIVQHGLAINVKNDAQIFSCFDPCGIKSMRVTSAMFHTSLPLSLDYYQERLVHHFLANFRARTKMGTNFDVGVLLSSATERSGTNALPSGK